MSGADRELQQLQSVLAGVPPPTVDVDGIVDETRGVRYIGLATLQPNGKYHCLASFGAPGYGLVLVEVSLRFGGT